MDIGQAHDELHELRGDYLKIDRYLTEHPEIIRLDKESGGSLMSSAAIGAGWATAAALIAHGAEPDPVPNDDSDAYTPLMWASYNGQAEMVELLLKHGANPNYANKNHGETHLTGAAHWGHTPVVQSLINAGAEVDKPCGFGETPLMYAILGGNWNTVTTLLEAGADPNKSNQHGSAVVEYALGCGAARSVIKEIIENQKFKPLPKEKKEELLRQEEKRHEEMKKYIEMACGK